jgi:hypothetical protein
MCSRSRLNDLLPQDFFSPSARNRYFFYASERFFSGADRRSEPLALILFYANVGNYMLLLFIVAMGEPLYQRALHIREQAFGVDHPKTIETRKRFIALLYAMGQHEEAVQLEAVQSEL